MPKPKTSFDPKTWDPTCGRSGYYSKEASPMNSVRVLASPDSRLKSQPAYGFSHEKRPRPGAKQAQRLEMPPQPVTNASPGPIYLPDIEKDGQKPTPPRYSISNGRHKDLRSNMNNPAPDAYHPNARIPTRPQYGFGTATRSQANMIFIHPNYEFRGSTKHMI